MPIGAAEPAAFRESTAILPPGSSLLLYTDGLVERRDEPLDQRLEKLAEAAGAAGTDLNDLCERVLSGVLGDVDPGDDVALLAVRPLPVADTHVSLTLPAEPGLARAAEAAAGALPACDRGHRGRAVRDHAHHLRGGRQRDRARVRPRRRHLRGRGGFDSGELTATVRDSGSWREKRGKHRGRGLSIIEDLMDEVTVERDEGGTLIRMRRRIREDRAA